MAKVRTDFADLDAVRRLILECVSSRDDISMDSLSLKIGHGRTYINDFVWYGSPRRLNEDDREKLAPLLGVAPDELRAPRGLAEAEDATESGAEVGEAAAAPYESRDLWGDLLPALDRLHRDEGVPLDLRELAVLAHDLHADILAAAGDGDLQAAMEAALAAHRRVVRQNRRAILSGQPFREDGRPEPIP